MLGMTYAKQLKAEEWDELAPIFSDLSYRQCRSYAEIAARDSGAKPEFVAILRSKEVIGVASPRIKTVPFVNIGIAYLDHAPMTVRQDEFSSETFVDCLDALIDEYVKRRHLTLRV